jgi:prepilin-type processing-associated H-X9-DG protein
MWEGRHGALFCFAGDRSMLVTTRRGAAFLLHMLAQIVDPSPDSPLEPALTAAAGKNALVAGATGAAFRALVGLSPQKDKEFTALGRASAVMVAANLKPDFKLTVKADFPDQVTAREGQSALAAMTGWATDALKSLAAGPDKADADLARVFLAALRDAGEPVREGKTVTIAVRMKADEFARTGAAFTQIAVTRIQTAANRMKSSNNLKQMALAILNFESAYGQFPFTDRPMGVAHPGLSWRVAILPYIEADELYKQFKLDEPWDSDHNKKLIEKMPKVFAPPPGVEAKAGHTFYRMFDGPGTMCQVKKISDVTDGTSNTLMIVEAGEPVVWTKPDDLEYDAKKPLPKLGGHFADGFNAVFADGHARFIRKGIDEKVLRALITANGGEPVTLDKD